jgi:hypothetical protein
MKQPTEAEETEEPWRSEHWRKDGGLWTPDMPHEVTSANGFPEDYWEGEYRGYTG